MVKIAFEIIMQLKTQIIAFVYCSYYQLQIIELCFRFSMITCGNCERFRYEHFHFTTPKFNPQEMMIKRFINIS